MAESKMTTAATETPRASAGAPVCAELHVVGFRRARADRRSALVEDYVELIADMIDGDGVARQVDIAARLGVTQPTVAKMLKRLHVDKLVTCTPYKGVRLTETGHRLAVQSRERHHLVEAFLLSLGVSPEAARCDAEGIEHHVSRETLDAFARTLRHRGETNAA